ncbi:MAG: hypothetical protein RBR53_06815 [Desulforegulaceae bacterium]|nr:hypothetical protein [Desulforegulaceae bacterium]
MVTIDIQGLPEKLQQRQKFSTSAGLITRLVVNQKYKGKVFGEWLLVDALKKLLFASEIVAFSFIVVDVKEGAKLFYEKYGFT